MQIIFRFYHLEVKDIINNLLKLNPYERMSIPEILQSKWMKEGENENEEENEKNIDLLNQKMEQKPNTSHHIIETLHFSNLVPEGSSTSQISYTDFIRISNEFHTQHIDEDALRVIESFGYNKEYIKKSLEKNELNHATTCYELLLL